MRGRGTQADSPTTCECRDVYLIVLSSRREIAAILLVGCATVMYSSTRCKTCPEH